MASLLYTFEGKIQRSLSEEATLALKTYQKSLSEKSYTKLNCLCGSENSRLISETDKYGFRINFVICQDCSLMRIDPYFTTAQLEQLYSSLYRKVKDEKPEDLFVRQIKKGKVIESFISKKIGADLFEQVIEIGCGAGGILAHFQKSGKSTIGYDLDKTYLQFGIKKGLDLRNEDVIPYLTSMTREKKSLVIINHVLEHVSDIRSFFDLIYNQLHPGTYVYLSVPGTLLYPTLFFPRQLIKLFMFAHPWNFNLATFKYFLLNGKNGQILAEDESINLFLQKNDYRIQVSKPDSTDYRKTLRYLQKMRRKERFFQLIAPVLKLKRKIRSVFQ